MKRTRIDSLNAAGSFFIFMLFLMCAVVLAFAIMAPITISEAMEKPNIMSVERQLQGKGPFDARANGWFEQQAMKNVVANYNKNIAKSETNKKYEIYKLGKDHFWITNQQMEQDEISIMTIRYFECIDGLRNGRSNSENEFCFRCTSQAQKNKMENIINESELMKAAFNIDVDTEQKGEVTFVTLKVASR